jgi:hydrogenase expression/formation protein HypC
MQIKGIDGLIARCEAKGVERDVNLLMLMHEELKVGDYIVVHLGRAIERVSAEDAATAWALYDEMLADMDAGAPADLTRERAAPQSTLRTLEN